MSKKSERRAHQTRSDEFRRNAVSKGDVQQIAPSGSSPECSMSSFLESAHTAAIPSTQAASKGSTTRSKSSSECHTDSEMTPTSSSKSEKHSPVFNGIKIHSNQLGLLISPAARLLDQVPRIFRNPNRHALSRQTPPHLTPQPIVPPS